MDKEDGRSPADEGSGCEASPSAATASSQSRIPNADVAIIPLIDLGHILRNAGWCAYLACLRAEKIRRRTRNLGLPRATYATEYAESARSEVEKYLIKQFTAFANPKSGDTE